MLVPKHCLSTELAKRGGCEFAQDDKLPYYAALILFKLSALTIAVKHHPAVRACDIGACEVLAGILVSYDHIVDIVHRV